MRLGSQSVSRARSGSMGPRARHGPGCDTAGAVVQAGAKHKSVNLKAVARGRGGQPWLRPPRRAVWGRGQPAAPLRLSCP